MKPSIFIALGGVSLLAATSTSSLPLALILLFVGAVFIAFAN